MTPIKAIRAKCLDCCCDNAAEVERCPCVKCSLYPFRFGKNPNIKGGSFNLTDEQKAANAERLRKYRESQRNEAIDGEGV